ncbi:CPXV078 protein [Cowpox virus]|uniref:CPXV078 protein n=1 Tax=Cowpox virus TaxID=10243 RepID=G0XUK6_COWPX|nr:hypothetical protein CPXV_GER1980_EP4_073 [Cowpox virus]AGY98120.1 CPXV078 protein [Cowpox virus]ARR30157.1 CPXV078 protein [Cowpox virus]ARR30266.1 CPXV078 protein [Cowpox virus]AZY90611.1 CPXV078 protein [Cowpox virus]
MFMYPEFARKALSKLISKKLNIEKVSSKHQLVLLDYGLHGLLPKSLYLEAINSDILNVRFFPPEIINVTDIIKALQNSCRVDEYLKAVSLYHKNSLMVSGPNVVKLMIEYNLLTHSDLEWLINENVIKATYLLKINAYMINFKIDLTVDEIIDLVKDIPVGATLHLYNILNNLDLNIVLRISDEYNIPPVHDILSKLTDEEMCIKLVTKYPMDNVINFINQDVRYSPTFIKTIKDFVNEHLPTMYDGLNDYLHSVIIDEDLIEEYKIKSVAMFNLEYKTDVDTLTLDEQIFVEVNISYYDFRYRQFADEFRDYIMIKERRQITMQSGDRIRRFRRPMSLRSTIIKKDTDSLEDILAHIDNARKNSKVSIEDVERIISSFRLNPCVVRRTMLSDIDIKTKIMVLKIVKDWKSCALTLSAIKGIMVTDTINTVLSKILHHHRNVFKYLTSVENKEIAVCNCSRCLSLFYRELKSVRCDLHTDDGLLDRLYDLTRYALHGKINQNLIGQRCWGPLTEMLFNENKKKKLNNLMEYIKISDMLVYGHSIEKTLIPITDSLSFKLSVDTMSVLNDQYAKVVIFFNTIIEYIVATIYYRLAVLDNYATIRHFVSKVLHTVMEACGVLFSHIKVNDKIEHELEEMVDKGIVPSYLYHLSINVISIILDDINGTR